MTLKELIKLDEEGLVPDFLKKKWEERHGEDPIEEAKSHIRRVGLSRAMFFLAILVFVAGAMAGMIIINLATPLSLGLERGLKAGLGGFVIVFGLVTAVVILNFLAPQPKHESLTKVGRFAQNFGWLKEWKERVEKEQKESLSHPDNLQLWVNKFLVQEALRVAELEKKRQENNSGFETESPVGSVSESRLLEMFYIFQDLGLAEFSLQDYREKAQDRLRQEA